MLPLALLCGKQDVLLRSIGPIASCDWKSFTPVSGYCVADLLQTGPTTTRRFFSSLRLLPADRHTQGDLSFTNRWDQKFGSFYLYAPWHSASLSSVLI